MEVSRVRSSFSSRNGSTPRTAASRALEIQHEGSSVPSTPSEMAASPGARGEGGAAAAPLPAAPVAAADEAVDEAACAKASS